jgi:S-adenosylmethionine/arginine decarboxylase-like enzyme
VKGIGKPAGGGSGHADEHDDHSRPWRRASPDRARLADPDSIRRMVPALVDAIGMQAHGPLMIERFGTGELEGWSALQFIETSSITIHADEVFGRCFVDVFSCRAFDPDVAAAVVVAHFGGTPSVTVLQR